MGSQPSNILSADISVITGMASALDLTGKFYSFNRSATPAEADFRAIYHDWCVLGDDLRKAMTVVENSVPSGCQKK